MSRGTSPPPRRQRVAELLIFVISSAVGIYALGTGLQGLFDPSAPIGLGWLAVAGLAFFVLVAQMGRVQDTWPRKQGDERRLPGGLASGTARGVRGGRR